MKIEKVRDVKTPSRGTPGSAGLDFYVPEDSATYHLPPGYDALIPSGIKAQVPKGHMLVAMCKSGVATKKKLIVGACVVDEDYQGEIHLHVINTSSTEGVPILPGEKLVQFILVPVLKEDVEVVVKLPEYASERGAGGFGSTGNY